VSMVRDHHLLAELTSFQTKDDGVSIVTIRYIDWCSKGFVYQDVPVEIGPWTGTGKIEELPIYPVEFWSDYPNLKDQLIKRGRKFVGLKGCHHAFYKGILVTRQARTVYTDESLKTYTASPSICNLTLLSTDQ
jgi:hypothetical protein